MAAVGITATYKVDGIFVRDELRSCGKAVAAARATSSLQKTTTIARKHELELSSGNKKFEELLQNLAVSSKKVAGVHVAIAAGIAGLPAAALADVDDSLAELDNSVGQALLFIQENPLLIAGISGVILVPVLLTSIFKGRGYAGDISAEKALELLGESGAFLLDIRSKTEREEIGSPSLKVIRKKPVNIPFQVEIDDTYVDDPSFAEKVSAIKGVETESVIVILDSLGGVAPAAARVLAKAGFDKSYAIIGGAEGSNGWKESGLAWNEPSLAFKVDLSAFKEAFSSVEADGSLVPTTLGVFAAAGISLVLLSEVETALQLLGGAALVQVFLKKLLYAKDRKKTLEEIKIFLDTKVAPQGLVDEIKSIGTALLPGDEIEDVAAGLVEEVKISGEGQGATEAGESDASTEDVKEQIPVLAEEVKEQIPVLAEEVKEQIPVLAEEVKDSRVADGSSTDLPPSPQPLSPYVQYPDLKPPTSPTPKQP